MTIRRESGRSREAVRKFFDIALHRGMPKRFEAKFMHFGDGLLGAPLLESDAVGREQHSGAIAAKPAVNEDGVLRMNGEHSKELGHLLVARRRPGITGNEHEFHA